MKSLSAVIITLNEEANIGRCIDSLWYVADEIIILDSFSSDNTVSIAKELGAIVKQEMFTGYKEQKNRALKLTKYDYILSLDADEVLSPELIAAILKAKKDFQFKAYSMNRYTIIVAVSSNMDCGILTEKSGSLTSGLQPGEE